MILLRKYDTGVNWIKNVFYVIFCSGKWYFYANTTLCLCSTEVILLFPQSSHSSPFFPYSLLHLNHYPLFPLVFFILSLISFPFPLVFFIFSLIFPLFAHTFLYFPLFILIFLCCLWVVNEVTGRSFKHKSDVSRTLTAWVSVNGAWSASVKRQQNY